MTVSFPPKANKLKLNLHNIEQKNFIKYLGIYIDKNLNWATHIQHINSKISKNLEILFRLRHFLTLNTLNPSTPTFIIELWVGETYTQVD